MRMQCAVMSILFVSSALAVDLQPGEIITMDGRSEQNFPQLAGQVVWSQDRPFTIENNFGFEMYKATLKLSVVFTQATNSYMFECRLSDPDAALPGQVKEIRWKGFLDQATDCDWRTDLGLGDAVAMRAGRSLDGSEVTFGYNWWDMNPGGEELWLDPGEKTSLMYIHTLAPNYIEDAGTITVELATGESWSVFAPAPGQTQADINGDGVVDGADLGMLIADWGTTGPEADLNFDGVVDGGDLGVLLAAW